MQIKNRIEKIVNEACKELDIDSVPIYYISKSDIYMEYNNNTEALVINIDYNVLIKYIKIKSKSSLWKFFKFNSVNRRLKFILYHEVGHCLQWAKYNKFFKKEYKKELYKREKCKIGGIPEYVYRQLKLEKIADNIAVSLMNRQAKRRLHHV